MAAKDRDLIKPSIISFFANAIVGVVFAIPIIGAAILLGGESLVGRGVLFVLGAITLFAQYTVSYVFSGMTVYLIYGYLSEGDGRMDKAWEIVKRDLLDLMSLAAASAVVKIVENALRGRNGRRNVLGELLANILNTVWTTATYFVLPAMIIEDLNLPNALKRATYMIKNNLLLVAVSYVGVNAITGFVGFVLVAGAVVFGIAVIAGLGSLLDTAGVIAGIVLAVAAFVLVVAVVTVFTSYIGTAYHTCLFIWAREAEQAQAAGQPAQAVQAPAPLAAVLR
jgi:hypothetical protein